MSRLQLIHGCVVNFYNETHPKFGITFAIEEMQLALADMATVRLNLTNPYADSNVNFGIDLSKYPTDNRRNRDLGWTYIALDRLEESRDIFPIQIRFLREGNKEPMMYLSMGPFR
jgi:hypothetical protein